MVKKKNPILAAILGLFGPPGYLYMGWRYAIAALFIWIVFVFVVYFLGFPIPRWVGYLIGLVFAWKAYTITTVRNELIEAKSQDDVHLLDSFQVAYMAMTDLLGGIGMFYAGVMTLYASVLMLLEGSIIRGLLTLIIGTPLIVWFASLIFGFIIMLMDALVAIIFGLRAENIFRKR